ncbi:hypothetical protein ACF0H5_019423 [Mactra antiquata]
MAFRQNQRITADIVQMPMEISEEEDDDKSLQPISQLKRNLLGDFSRPSILEPHVQHEHMKVYLRIRPFSDSELQKHENQECLSLLSDKTVSTNPPKDSHFFKNMSRGSCKTTTKYTFSHVFSETTTQKDFFGSTMLDLVKDFIDGQNCLVFSYGVTSSGKTYTIQGNPRDAGILPRALDVIFNSIGKCQWEGLDLKPKMFMDVTRLTQEQEMAEVKIKERVMKLSCDDDMDVMSLLGDDSSDRSTISNATMSSETSAISHNDTKNTMDVTDDLFDELATRVREEERVSVDEQGQVKFSVWVSFAEIYNEQIYDLLEPMPKQKNARRACLKLSEDKSGSPYIKGLKHIQVNSADEAYKLLSIGQRNLQTACTKLNHNSSRRLTLCDLAGSERYGKTKASGERLKEAGNINTSLLTLGRCIETLRYNQAHKDNAKIVPFRESKLTRLFQNFFVGQGKAAMIVNVNQLASMFDETMHVFKFSALASKVEVHQKPVFIKPKLPVKPAPTILPRTSIAWATPARNQNLKQTEAQNEPLPDDNDDVGEDDDFEDDDYDGPTYTQENIDELLGVIDQLQEQLDEEIKSKTKLEKRIRKEVCGEMMKQFSEIEEQYSERIRLREQWAEELAEKRIQLVLKAEREHRQMVKTDKDDEWVSSILLHQEKVKVETQEQTIQDLETEVKDLKSKVESLEEDKESHLEEMSKKVGEYEERIQILEDDLMKEKDNSSTIDEMSQKMSEYETKIKSLEAELSKKQTEIEESNKADLVENITQQLQQSRHQIKEQETEIKELNDMLTEAGETFETKQSEIDKLKGLCTDYEKKMEEQAETIKVLERAASDSKVAMETADVSLSKREECVSSLQKEIRDLEGSESDKMADESKSVALTMDNIDKVKSHKSDSYHFDSSGVVADCESEDLSDNEIIFKMNRHKLQVTESKDSVGSSSHLSADYSGSDTEDEREPQGILQQNARNKRVFNFREATQSSNSNYFQFHKPLNDSRVLQVIVSPVKNKNVVKHTKSSMLRLKNSPIKDPTRGRECMKVGQRSLTLSKSDTKLKRKCDENNEESDELNTSKRRKVVASKTKKSKTKPVATNRMGQKYNLRTRK